MGLLDQIGVSLKGVLGSPAGAEAPMLISALLAKAGMGNMQDLVDRLQQGGLGDQVKSWLGNGANAPVTPQQIRSALGNEQLKQLAQHFGVDTDAVAKLLAEHLPAAVDAASPNGTIEGS